MPYHAPTDLREALTILQAESALVVAGGTDYFAAHTPGHSDHSLLDITRIRALRGIEVTANGIRIGGATCWSEVAKAPLPPGFDGLRQAAREVGSLQIQNAGTIAGNLCNASPAADGMPPLLTLDATVELSSLSGTRTLHLSEFVTGVRQTQLRKGELLTALTLPSLPAHTQGGFGKLGTRRYLVISIAMVAVIIGCDKSGQIDFARVAVGACSPVAQRLKSLEHDLIGSSGNDFNITEAHLVNLSPIDDVRGSAGYRMDAVATQIRRAIQQACGTEHIS